MNKQRRAPFPQELIDLIIDDDPDDRESLHTLALVSKSCLAQSRRHIFRSIRFITRINDVIHSTERHRQFRSILSGDPKVANCVRELLIRDSPMPRASDYPVWIRDDASFHDTLQLLAANGLERFTLECGLEWTSFPLSLRRALRNVYTAPTLEFISLRGLSAVPMSSCIAFGQRVSELLLINVELSRNIDTELPEVAHGHGAAKLYWLGLEEVDAESTKILLSALLPHPNSLLPARFSSLAALHIGPIESDSVEALWDVVHAGRDTIQYFNWEYLHKSIFVPPLDTHPIVLEVLDRLFAINFEVTFYPDDYIDPPGGSRDQFGGLLALLGSVKPTNTIQDVMIRVNYNDVTEALESMTSYDGWGRLDALLCSAPFADLRDVTLELDVLTSLLAEENEMDAFEDEVDLEQRGQELRRAVVRCLPTLNAEELLRFVVKVRGKLVFN
ncbi:hypothetical protein H0H81_011899 [Sphagnurus paluster]|uniref:Uncharacterized protein n=1 Tax=Sphagnurus paluster TaxID=117069 RepID=A0A9P7FY92_9AGAR|nr:hypothetical protein H0H81_011899 [Sphagnurus paluster]